jgi:hypothetical protein
MPSRLRNKTAKTSHASNPSDDSAALVDAASEAMEEDVGVDESEVVTTRTAAAGLSEEQLTTADDGACVSMHPCAHVIDPALWLDHAYPARITN